MDAFFKELGDTILARWKRENFSLPKFPEIARAALDKKPPAKKVDLAALMHDFLLAEDQPVQTDSPFGEPELVVYSHPRFYIQLLFWMDGTTAIHQHEFSGAFHVMHGSSIHAHYAFDNATAVTPYIRVGDVRMKKMELLKTGSTVPIGSGSADIHSLFHLDSPSVTVVVRTQHDPGTGPQLNYLPPHVAIDPHFSDTLMLRRKQLLDVLEQSQDTGYADVVLEMIADLDFERGFSVLQHCMAHLQQLDAWHAALGLYEKKHGPLARGIGATLAEDVRRGTIKSFRGSIVEPEHRFFLALLMNAPTRDDLLSLVAQRFPKKDPVDIVLRWAEELTEVSDAGATLLDVVFPHGVKVDSDGQLHVFLSAFRHFLVRDKEPPADLMALRPAEMKALREAFAESAMSICVR